MEDRKKVILKKRMFLLLILIFLIFGCKKKYLSPKINNLRLRESSSSKGKIIRSLSKGEKLELIETGKSETIKKEKGTWVKVKTLNKEIGWCFDTYLEEYKEKSIQDIKKIYNNERKWFRYKEKKGKDYILYEIYIYQMGDENKDNYKEVFDFNKYIIKFNKDKYIEFYIKYNKKDKPTYNSPLILKYYNKDITKEIKLKARDVIGFLEPTYLKYYKTGDFILQTSSGHEGFSNYILYNNQKNRYIDIFKLLRKEIGNNFRLYINVKLEKNHLIIDESNSRFDEGLKDFELYTFDKNSLKIISREKKKKDKPLFYF